MKVKHVKLLALIGSLFIGGSMIAGGDVMNGTGVIAAALSSAGVISTPAQ